MKIEQRNWTEADHWMLQAGRALEGPAHLVLMFGATAVLRDRKRIDDVRVRYPGAHILGCSTAGEICGTQVCDHSLVTTAVKFEDTQIKGAQVSLAEAGDSFNAGQFLGKALDSEGLVHVLVLSDGLGVNGSHLVRGLTKHLPDKVTVTGGLAGDGERFKETLVMWDDAIKEDMVAAAGFYGSRIRVGYGSLGGWDPFGPERLVTRSEGNVLYELDGRSALDLYKLYLGEHASGLPATGLLFPLSLRTKTGGTGVVRTILSVDEKEQSMTFAGDVPEGAYVRLMKANFDRLIDGAVGAAETSYQALGSASPDLAVLISCIGRKLVLKQRVEEEVEGVREILGEHAVLTGFYSYGEIAPFMTGAKCELHNQTMTITTFSED
ncbi:MAG: FIST C-terminal domain-containing protein [Deltaproteobacteria bacterium]|nr:FIST C-terminal domain-containing protein [Deltaproteobacteria bacterium]